MTRRSPPLTTGRRTPFRLVLCVAALSGGAATSARAEDIAFVEATSELDEGRPATWAYNVVDGKETTSWCSSKNPDGNQALAFGFDQPVTVTHLALIVGTVKGEGLDKETRRARIVQVADTTHRVEARFKDTPELQVLELTPPAKGRRIVVEFPETADGSAPDAPICIAEVQLKQKAVLLTPPSTPTKLRGLNTPSKRLLHEWIDDVSAPERTLLFNMDGTFSYRFEPLMDGKPAKLRGKWRAVDRSVTLEVGTKTYTLSSRLTKLQDGDENTVELVLEGEGPHPSMSSTFRPAPTRLP